MFVFIAVLIKNVLCRCALHCLARCLHMSTCDMYALRDLHFTPAQQRDLTVRCDSFSYVLTYS